MNDLRTAAQQALEALEEYQAKGAPFWACDGAVAALRAALAEHFCDTHCTWADHAPGCVRAEPVLERNFCPRCGKRSFPDTIHTCTPP